MKLRKSGILIFKDIMNVNSTALASSSGKQYELCLAGAFYVCDKISHMERREKSEKLLVGNVRQACPAGLSCHVRTLVTINLIHE